MNEEYEENQYFYYPDHASTLLSTGSGSCSFITNAIGYAEQHLQYLPFWESFIDQRNSYSSRNTFSSKEKDDELRSNRRTPLKINSSVRQTQYSYFGARYYDSDLSVWLSVDSLGDYYPLTFHYEKYSKGNDGAPHVY